MLLIESILRATKNNFIFLKTPLHYAAQNGHSEAVRFLITKGCDKDAKDRLFFELMI